MISLIDPEEPMCQRTGKDDGRDEIIGYWCSGMPVGSQDAAGIQHTDGENEEHIGTGQEVLVAHSS